MARHRSPGGRARRKGAHRSSSIPLPLRGAAVAAVTGSAFSLVTVGGVPDVPGAATATLRLASDSPDDAADAARDAARDAVRRIPSVEPVRTGDRGDRGGRDGREDDGDRGSRDERILDAVRRAEERAADARRKADEDRARADADRRARDAAAQAGADADRNGGNCAGLKTGGLGAVKPHVRQAAGELGCRFGTPTMFGVAGRGGPSDHPGGLAIDFMVNRATGDRLADCALANMKALGVKYVIWRQRINFGSGWKPMEDRGGVTANHYDHVHVSFNRGAGGGGLSGC